MGCRSVETLSKASSAKSSQELAWEVVDQRLKQWENQSWQLREEDIDICLRPDGSDWRLGTGSYGTVSSHPSAVIASPSHPHLFSAHTPFPRGANVPSVLPSTITRLEVAAMPQHYIAAWAPMSPFPYPAPSTLPQASCELPCFTIIHHA